jgi:cytochrome c5
MTLVGVAVAAGMLASWQTPSSAARADYVGSETCGGCHSSALEVWQRSAHARASESLGRGVSDRRCLACHATGDAPAGRPYGSGVGCEMCHGSGAGYAPDDVMRDPVLARELGLRELGTTQARTALCMSCHRASTRLTPFDVEAAWRSIAHGGDNREAAQP